MTTQIQIDGEIFQNAIKILKDLISFQTESGKSNLELIDYCELRLKNSGASSLKTFNNSKTQANLFSTINGENPIGMGIVLSGHTDVVPAVHSEWTSNPYLLRQKDDKKTRHFCLQKASFGLPRGGRTSLLNTKTRRRRLKTRYYYNNSRSTALCYCLGIL